MDIMDMLEEQFGEKATRVQRVLPDGTVVVTLDRELIPFEKKLLLMFTNQTHLQLIPFCRLKIINNCIAKAVIIQTDIQEALTEDELTAIIYHELGHLNDPAILAKLHGVDDTRDENEAEVYADNYAVKHGYGRYIISALKKATDVAVRAMEQNRSLGDPDEARDELTKIALKRAANLQQSISTFEQHHAA